MRRKVKKILSVTLVVKAPIAVKAGPITGDNPIKLRIIFAIPSFDVVDH